MHFLTGQIFDHGRQILVRTSIRSIYAVMGQDRFRERKVQNVLLREGRDFNIRMKRIESVLSDQIVKTPSMELNHCGLLRRIPGYPPSFQLFIDAKRDGQENKYDQKKCRCGSCSFQVFDFVQTPSCTRIFLFP